MMNKMGIYQWENNGREKLHFKLDRSSRNRKENKERKRKNKWQQNNILKRLCIERKIKGLQWYPKAIMGQRQRQNKTLKT